MTEFATNQVISRDGVRGELAADLPADAAPSDVLIRFETGQQALVPVDALSLQADGRYYYLALRLDELAQHGGGVQSADQPYIVPVIEERLSVERRRREIGRVRVRKHVQERTEVVDEPLLRDNVTVRRVPVNRVIDQAVGVRQDGETLIVPVLEEVLVVEKRLLLVEEVHITRHTVEVHQPEEVTLRREAVTVERIAPAIDGTESAREGATPNQ